MYPCNLPEVVLNCIHGNPYKPVLFPPDITPDINLFAVAVPFTNAMILNSLVHLDAFVFLEPTQNILIQTSTVVFHTQSVSQVGILTLLFYGNLLKKCFCFDFQLSCTNFLVHIHCVTVPCR